MVPGETPNHRQALSLPGGPPVFMKSLKERFDDKWEPVTESGCWIWMASTHRTGYGQLFIRNRKQGIAKNMRAHRLAGERSRGPIPDGMNVCHKCDIRSCVNPDHLFLGTHQDNMDDMYNKGRNNTTARFSKLTYEQVLEIKNNLSVFGAEFARRYGVTEATISYIRNGKTWVHV